MFTGTAVSLYTPQLPIHCFLTNILHLLSVNLFCSLSIVHVLKRPTPGQGEMERRGGGEREKKAMKKRAFTMMLINNLPKSSHVPAIRLHQS